MFERDGDVGDSVVVSFSLLLGLLGLTGVLALLSSFRRTVRTTYSIAELMEAMDVRDDVRELRIGRLFSWVSFGLSNNFDNESNDLMLDIIEEGGARTWSIVDLK